jgi:hypothetical protein
LERGVDAGDREVRRLSQGVIQRVAARREIALYDTGVQSSLTGLVETAATAPISTIHGFLKGFLKAA